MGTHTAAAVVALFCMITFYEVSPCVSPLFWSIIHCLWSSMEIQSILITIFDNRLIACKEYPYIISTAFYFTLLKIYYFSQRLVSCFDLFSFFTFSARKLSEIQIIFIAIGKELWKSGISSCAYYFVLFCFSNSAYIIFCISILVSFFLSSLSCGLKKLE